MQKNKRPAPRKAAPPAVDKDELLSQELCSLALAQDPELRYAVRRSLKQQQDAVLYGALELARGEDADAYRHLKEAVEEDAGTVLLRKGEDGPELEINAFAIPVFVHSQGGLRQQDCFQDPDAYTELLDSFIRGGLESPDAKLVLVQHAYDLAEAERITYGQLNAMVREAAATLGSKKLAAAPALERSIAGWQPSAFAATDEAVELRFLLGFALKHADDPFYRLPASPARQDAWFAARLQRYRAWTESAAAMVARCLAGARPLRLNFLYQDLFYGALQQGRREYDTLAMLAAMQQALAGSDPGAARAVITLIETDEDAALQVQLLGPAGELASAARRLDVGDDVEAEIEDLQDALSTLGLSAIAVELTAP